MPGVVGDRHRGPGRLRVELADVGAGAGVRAARRAFGRPRPGPSARGGVVEYSARPRGHPLSPGLLQREPGPVGGVCPPPRGPAERQAHVDGHRSIDPLLVGGETACASGQRQRQRGADRPASKHSAPGLTEEQLGRGRTARGPSSAPRWPPRGRLDLRSAQGGHPALLPSWTASIAARPKRVASTRSNAVGVPPRWTCPARWRSPLARCGAVLALEPMGDAAEARVPNASVGACRGGKPPSGIAPSATTRIGAYCCSNRLDVLADAVDAELLLGDQDHVGPVGDAGVKRDPAGMSSYHLDDQHPVGGSRRSCAGGSPPPSRC